MKANIDKLNANGGTNIANGINGAVELFDETGSASRQKYIILMSDGEDSSASAQAATDASGKRITICALAIGSNSSQMETIANNTKGYYKNSPTAEQIGEMMNMFADVVFNNAGTDVSFTATLNRNASADIDNMTPAPVEIIENENGTKTLKWTFDKLTIDQSEHLNDGTFSGVSKLKDSDVSAVFCFVKDSEGRKVVAGSCNYDYNPTISVPEGYFADMPTSPSSDYYFKKYNQLLSKDYISKMDVPDSVKAELGKLTDAVEFTKGEALKANKYYEFGTIKETSFMKNRSVSNCAEIWAAREAILNGAKFDDLK